MIVCKIKNLFGFDLNGGVNACGCDTPSCNLQPALFSQIRGHFPVTADKWYQQSGYIFRPTNQQGRVAVELMPFFCKKNTNNILFESITPLSVKIIGANTNNAQIYHITEDTNIPVTSYTVTARWKDKNGQPFIYHTKPRGWIIEADELNGDVLFKNGQATIEVLYSTSIAPVIYTIELSDLNNVLSFTAQEIDTYSSSQTLYPHESALIGSKSLIDGYNIDGTMYPSPPVTSNTSIYIAGWKFAAPINKYAYLSDLAFPTPNTPNLFGYAGISANLSEYVFNTIGDSYALTECARQDTTHVYMPLRFYYQWSNPISTGNILPLAGIPWEFQINNLSSNILHTASVGYDGIKNININQTLSVCPSKSSMSIYKDLSSGVWYMKVPKTVNMSEFQGGRTMAFNVTIDTIHPNQPTLIGGFQQETMSCPTKAKDYNLVLYMNSNDNFLNSYNLPNVTIGNVVSC